MNQGRRKIWPIDRAAGVAKQFFWTGDSYVYRRDGFGAAIPVTAQERDQFVRQGRTSLLLHIASLLLVIWAAMLATTRLYSLGSSVAHAAVVALVASGVGLALYRSHAWYADAAHRALGHRPPVGPAGNVDVKRWPSYGTIAGMVVILSLIIALNSRSTMVLTVFTSIVAVVVGLAIAAMKWWFERGFTPAQREKAVERRAVVRKRDQAAFAPGQALLLLVFLVVEMAVLLGVFLIVMGVCIGLSGTAWGDPSPPALPFVGGMILGFAAAGLAVWPLEVLCKRWTGTGALDAFNGFPF